MAHSKSKKSLTLCSIATNHLSLYALSAEFYGRALTNPLRNQIRWIITIHQENLAMEIPFRSLAWLTYRLTATFAFSLPFILFIWATIRKEAAIVRLTTIYWKIASIIPITMLLLIGERPIGYLTSFIAPFLVILSIWFWSDLNEEIADLPPWRAISLTVRLWRWALTGSCLIIATVNFFTLPCIRITNDNCLALLEAPKGLHGISKVLFNFLFGANWTEPLAAFVGYVALLAYVVGLIQWILIRFPKQGRISGEF